MSQQPNLRAQGPQLPAHALRPSTTANPPSRGAEPFHTRDRITESAAPDGASGNDAVANSSLRAPVSPPDSAGARAPAHSHGTDLPGREPYYPTQWRLPTGLTEDELLRGYENAAPWTSEGAP